MLFGLEGLIQVAGEPVSWQEVALAFINVIQVVLLAWIGAQVAGHNNRTKRK